jgi:N-methylhydantoinase B/oxoprolinase/acetone carboxylase alpha subunit
MAVRDETGFDGQTTVYRGNLYVHIDENGRVDFDIVRAERNDAPALVMACLVMCMKLTELIDEEGTR